MNFKEEKKSTAWVKRLPEVVLALNREETRLTERKRVGAIKVKSVDAKSPTSYPRPVGLKERNTSLADIITTVETLTLYKVNNFVPRQPYSSKKAGRVLSKIKLAVYIRK